MRIKDLDMAAAVIVATGQRPVINYNGDCLKGFTFSDDVAIIGAVARYVTDALVLPAKHLLRVRGDLYKQIRRKQ